MWLGFESLVLIQLNKMAWLKGNIDIAQKWDSLCFFIFMLHGYSSMKLFLLWFTLSIINPHQF